MLEFAVSELGTVTPRMLAAVLRSGNEAAVQWVRRQLEQQAITPAHVS
jgi:hypothetical protein